MACNEDLKKTADSWPRTCADCGLGPCKKYAMQPIAGDAIWVLMPDYGCEGLREPFMAFRSHETAQEAKALIEKNPSATTMKLCEVPMWKRG